MQKSLWDVFVELINYQKDWTETVFLSKKDIKKIRSRITSVDVNLQKEMVPAAQHVDSLRIAKLSDTFTTTAENLQ